MKALVGVTCVLSGYLCVTGASLARGIWLDVPFVRQSDRGCGSACAWMIVRYWDSKTGPASLARESEASIYRRLYSRSARGIPASSLESYLRSEGFRVYAFNGTWQDLWQHLSRGRPLIVCLNEGADHYSVVVGIDDGIVLVNDPARRKLLKLSRGEFEKSWKRSDNWTLLALP